MKINGTEIINCNDLNPQRETVLSGEYTTCNGETRADVVGWKYSDLTLAWDALPETELLKIYAASGETAFTFQDPVDGEVTENVIVTIKSPVQCRFIENGIALWKNISVTVRFLDAHN
mgnify:CR=1 FL=1